MAWILQFDDDDDDAAVQHLPPLRAHALQRSPPALLQLQQQRQKNKARPQASAEGVALRVRQRRRLGLARSHLRVVPTTTLLEM